jgi:hypothetical protein
MSDLVHHLRRVLPLTAAMHVVLLCACSTTYLDERQSTAGVISIPPDSGAIGLTVVRPCPEFGLKLPASKQEAAEEAAAFGGKGMLSDPNVVVLFPIAYVVGGIVGGLRGVSEHDLEAGTRAMTAAAQELRFDERVTAVIMEHFNASSPGRIRAIGDNMRIEPEAVRGHMERDARGKLVWVRPPTEAHPLRETDIETVIEVHVVSQGMQDRLNPRVSSNPDIDAINPPMALVLTVDVTAVRVKDWRSLGRISISYESEAHHFAEWVDDDARSLRAEMDQGMQFILRELKVRLAMSSSARAARESTG